MFALIFTRKVVFFTISCADIVITGSTMTTIVMFKFCNRYLFYLQSIITNMGCNMRKYGTEHTKQNEKSGEND